MEVRALLLAFLVCAPACSDDVEVGANSRLPSASGGAGGEAGSAGSGGSLECTPTMCKNRVFLCGNCLDDDQDGSIDAADAECLGPCDDTEDSFNSGIPSNNQCRQDCYFDNDSGSGNDGCYWSHRCDSRSVAPDYPPSADPGCAYDAAETVPGTSLSCAELLASQSESCRAACAPLTPNGCDCFGCCELPSGSGPRFVWLGSADDAADAAAVGCNLASVADPSRCHPCTPVAGCFNPCDRCEVCVGRPMNDPGSCPDAGSGGADPGQCAQGVQPCGRQGQPLCGANQYCISGCCVRIPA